MRQATRCTRGVLWGVVSAVVAFAPGLSPAATVRGRVVCGAPNRNPAAVYNVTVFRRDIGQSKPGTMGGDGTFYLYNVPPGPANLQLWMKQNPAAAPRVFQINVTEPYTQVPPLSLGC